MDLWRLKVFCRVISSKGFSSAAKELRLTQPTVSAHIKELESHFNCKLIDRINKQAKPTEAGQILFQSARKLLKDYDKLEITLSDYQGEFKGKLTIGGSNIPGEYILPRIAGEFRNHYPDIFLSLLIQNSTDIVSRILDDRIELGFVGVEINDNRICQTQCFEDELSLVTLNRDPWLKIDTIKAADLLGIPFITRKHGSGTLKTFKERIGTQGIDIKQMNVVAEFGSTTAVVQGIKNNLGASVISTIAVADELASGDLKAIRIEGVDLHRHFYMTYQKQRTLTPLAKLFMEFIEKGK